MSLIGPNGAGKTTFFNMLTGAYKPTSGDPFAGRDVGGLPPHRITKLRVGRTFQNISAVRDDDLRSRTCWSACTPG